MEPVYVIIDEKARDDFEKEWQIAYGYSDCEIFRDLDEAIIDFEEWVGEWDNTYIIEKVDSEGRELVYKR